MKVAIIGGTGRMGRALAKHLAKNNQVIIGSRDPGKARQVAKGIAGAKGSDYVQASMEADAAIISIPYSSIRSIFGLSKELEGKLVISLINPLKVEDGLLLPALVSGSAAEELASALPGSRVATAFNNVSSLFFEKEDVVPIDILVAADSKETYEAAAELVRSIPNLRPLYAGPLSQARIIEGVTALVLNLAKLNGTASMTTKFTSKKS